MGGSDKRQHSRLPVFLECKVEGASGFAALRITDLSVTGCYVDTRIPIQSGTRVTVQVTLAGSPVTLTGRVAHAHAGIGFGLQFDTLPAETQKAIARFLERLEYPPH